MKRVRIMASMMATTKYTLFEVNIDAVEGKETANSFYHNKKRIKKEDIGRVLDCFDALALIGYVIYVSEGEEEQGKEKVLEALRTRIEERVKQTLLMQEALGKEPLVRVQTLFREERTELI